MLQLILGRGGSGKTTEMRRLFCAHQPAEAAILLVPEQFTFEMEKQVLELAGPVLGNRLRVFSFTRLAEEVFRREGGEAGRRLSDSGRRILMSEAIAACQDHLTVYRGAAKGNRLTDMMLSAVNEMKLCGIGPQALTDTAEKVEGAGLRAKVEELGLIFGTYEAMVAASYLDPRDDLTRLEKALETSDFFQGCTVFVDSFEGFTRQELGVLRRIMTGAQELVVSLCTDGLEDDGMGLFSLVNRTKGLLEGMARENRVGRRPDILLESGRRFENPNLRLWEAQLYSPETCLPSEDSTGLRLFQGADPYEEAEYTASCIRQLVMEEGYRYQDFSILCRDPSRYYHCLGVSLEKRGIPCFVSAPVRVDAEPVMRFVLSAWDVVLNGFRTADLLALMKTGLSGLTGMEISELENYVYLWRLTGAAWKEPFTRHPRGFAGEWTGEDVQQLSKLEQLRQRLAAPLLSLQEATKDSTGEGLCQAIYEYLTAMELESVLPEYCLALEAQGEDLLAAKQVRVWEVLCGLLDQLHSILGTRKLPRERFVRLLREVISGEDVSDIPHRVDEVIFGTAEQVRQASPKVAFLLGAVQGEFPLTPKASGVFSDTERRELIAKELPLGDSLTYKTLEERYLAYSVACAPSQRLFLTYPRRVGGEDKTCSELVEQLRRIFPGIQVEKNLPDLFFANSPEAIFTRMAAGFSKDTPPQAAMRALCRENPVFAGRLQALERGVDNRPEEIENKELAGRFFGEAPFLSATQVETFFNCRFRYFCRYGLGAKERRPAEVDVMQYGTLMHYLFEHIFRGASPAQSDPAGLSAQIDGLINRYVEEQMGGWQLFTEREKYRLHRMGRSACALVFHVQKELAQSRFTPAYFELRLGEEPTLPPLKLSTPGGRTVTVGGTVDRVDIFQKETGEKYMRVIDYKTGKKEFRLSDVLYGLNMQMLVYLAALVQSGQALPAGILYMPAAEPTVSAGKQESPDKILDKAEKELCMNGVVLGEPEIITAMEQAVERRFIPVDYNKNGSLSRFSSVLQGEQMASVLQYSVSLIATMAQELEQGLVSATPQMKNQNACRFCPYGPVCGKENGGRDVEKERLSSQQVLQMMNGEAAQEAGDETVPF